MRLGRGSGEAGIISSGGGGEDHPVQPAKFNVGTYSGRTMYSSNVADAFTYSRVF